MATLGQAAAPSTVAAQHLAQQGPTQGCRDNGGHKEQCPCSGMPETARPLTKNCYCLPNFVEVQI